MRNKKPLSRSAQVIAFLTSQALEDEKPLVAKKARSTAPKKSTAKSTGSQKSKAIKKKVAFQSHRLGFHIGVAQV